MREIFIPGQEWMSWKLYMNEFYANQFLRDTLSSLIDKLRSEELIDNWFFIRYKDPDFHLRVRIKLKKVNHFNRSVSIIKKALKNHVDSTIWDIQLCCYKRELERYSCTNIRAVEKIFKWDSEMVLLFFKSYMDKEVENWDWKYTLFFIDAILSVTGKTCENKLVFIKDVLSYLEGEFQKKQQSYDIQQKYRQYRKEIERYVQELPSGTLPCYLSNQWRINIKKIQTRISCFKNISDFNKSTIVAGIIHMHCNRQFYQAPRRSEFIVYNLLKLYYTSIIKKNLYSDNKK